MYNYEENAVWDASDFDNERGMSLVELIVYVVLLAIIGTIITALLLNVFKVNTNVKSTSENSNSAQVIMERIEIAVRNATAVDVKEPSSGSQLLITETRYTSAEFDPEADLRCIGVYYDASTHNIYYLSEPAPSSRIKTAASNPVLGREWQILASDVNPVSGMKLFDKGTGAISVHMRVGGSNGIAAVQHDSMIDVRSVGGSTGGCF